MSPAHLLVLLVIATPLAGGASTLEVSNAQLARQVALEPWLHTVAIENRLTGHSFPVEGEEFVLHLEGESLASRDFAVTRSERSEDGGRLSVSLRHPDTAIEVEVVLTAPTFRSLPRSGPSGGSIAAVGS